MPCEKTPVARTNEPTSLDELKNVIQRELSSPGSVGDPCGELSSTLDDLKPVLAFLKLKHEHDRRAIVLKGEQLWFRRLGWKLMRPLFIVAIVAGVGFVLQRKVDPTLGVGLFLGGAASLYVAIQIVVHRAAFRGVRRLEEVDAAYRKALEELLGALPPR